MSTPLTCDRELAGERYGQIRQRLVRLFEWRGCDSAEDLADETMNQVAKRVANGLVLPSEPYPYFCGVAHLIYKEMLRRSGQEHNTEPDSVEKFRELFRTLPPDQRSLLRRYYLDERRIQSRKDLCEELGISMNALRIRVHRLRRQIEKLEAGDFERHAAELVDDAPATTPAEEPNPVSSAPISTEPTHHPTPPLEHLRHFLQTRFPVLYAQVLEPTLADLHLEHSAALAEGHPVKARCVLLRGYGALVAAGLFQLGYSLLGRIAALWQAKSPK